MAWFWVQSNNNHIILLPCFSFFFFLQGFLDLRFAVYYLVWCQQNRGKGMTMEWCTAEDWRLCQQDKRESEKQKREGVVGGFISITSGMPRTFQEWHVYGAALWQEHTHFIGFIKETRGGTSRIWDVVGVCVCARARARLCICARLARPGEPLLLCCASACFVCMCGVRREACSVSAAAPSTPAAFSCLYFGLSGPL